MREGSVDKLSNEHQTYGNVQPLSNGMTTGGDGFYHNKMDS